MRIPQFLTNLVGTVGLYIPFLGSHPCSPPIFTEDSSSETNSITEKNSKMKHKKPTIASPPKGKGKGKDKSGSGETIDLKDLNFVLPEFANGDHAKICPRYSSVLKRSEHDGIGMEDIDTLQMELEALLSSTVVRKMTLKDEVKVLCEAEKYRGKYGKRGPSSPGKRGITSGKESRSAKKLKLVGAKPVPNDAGKVIGVPKIKSETAGPSFDPLQNEQIRPVAETSKPVLPKNETPNRFWAFVEPYCAPITEDDVKLLEDLIKGHGDLSEYQRVPKLGQHYTQRWAKEDLESERLKSSSDPNASNDGKNDEAGQLLKKVEPNNEDSPFGEMTQRLVAGLLEENAISANDVDDATKKGSGGDSSDTENVTAKGQLIKSLNITNAENLEARVRKELEEQGILDPNDDIKDGDHDEILEELVRCQNELKALSNHNLTQLRRLLKAAKEEMARQEVRNKLQQADNEVMEAYKKITAARAKKKPPTKKERDGAWRALKEREIILRQLENI